MSRKLAWFSLHRCPSVNKKTGCGMMVLLLGLTLIVYTYIPSYLTLNLNKQRPCKLHKLDPWDKIIMQFVSPAAPVSCSPVDSLMFVDDKGMLSFNTSAISAYAVPPLKCTYQVVTRNGDFKVRYGPEIPFDPPIFVQSRVFRVTCRDDHMTILYDFVHFNIAYNETIDREVNIKPETDDHLSIIVIGLDSVSRSHALRYLPLTYKYLVDTLGAFDFKGYMKVGLNTYPNVVPMLTGKDSSSFLVSKVLIFHVDGLPFIWKEPPMVNYATHVSEDRPDISVFNYLKGGFKNPPSDYYYRLYGLALEDVEPVIMKPLGKSSWNCYGNKWHTGLQFDYLKQFLSKYSKQRRFAFLWNNMLSHESFLSLAVGDKPLLEYLKWLKSDGHLDRAMLIVGSDHGFRLGGASETYVGRLENNMPFLTVHFPKPLLAKYKWMNKNLNHNTDMLVSAYDLYATMHNVIYSKFEDSRPPTVSSTTTGRSLFTQVPPERTCADAGIPDQFCTCYNSVSMNTTDSLVQTIARFAVEHINKMLNEDKSLCATLELHNITDAKVIYSADGDPDKIEQHHAGFFHRLFYGEDFDESGRYTLMIYTSPNEGLFEVMVDYTSGTLSSMTVIGDPIRVNKYGNQPHCIDNRALVQYCYCRDLMVDKK